MEKKKKKQTPIIKKVDEHVQDLLYRFQCVIIPDFGAFISNRQPATIGLDKSMSPPSKRLTFNSRLISNDGLLAEHISKTEMVSFEAAQNKIRIAVKTWSTQLDAGQTIKFAEVGTLSRGPGKSIILTPSEDLNLLTDSFGMSSFVPQEVDKKTAPEGAQPSSVAEESAQEVEIKISKEMEKKEKKAKKAKEKGEKKKRPILKYAAIGLVAIGLVGYGVYAFVLQDSSEDIFKAKLAEVDIDQEVSKRLNEAVFFNNAPIELPSVSLTVVKAEPKPEAEAAPAPAEETKVAEQASTPSPAAVAEKAEKPTRAEAATPVASNSGLRYHVIAGSFGSEKNANARVRALKKQGFPSSQIVGQNARGLYQVAYKSFASQAEADAFCKDIKETQKLDGWVLER